MNNTQSASTTNSAGSMTITEIKMSKINPNPNNARKKFSEKAMKALVLSIQENKLFNPIQVKNIGEEKYQIISGERRFRAYQELKYSTIPCTILAVDNNQAEVISLAENIVRSNLTEIEKAEKIFEMRSRYGSALSGNQFAKEIGLSEAYVRHLGLLKKLPAHLMQEFMLGKLSAKAAVAQMRAEKRPNKTVVATKSMGTNSSVIPESMSNLLDTTLVVEPAKPGIDEYQKFMSLLETIMSSCITIEKLAMRSPKELKNLKKSVDNALREMEKLQGEIEDAEYQSDTSEETDNVISLQDHRDMHA